MCGKPSGPAHEVFLSLLMELNTSLSLNVTLSSMPDNVTGLLYFAHFEISRVNSVIVNNTTVVTLVQKCDNNEDKLNFWCKIIKF